MGRFALITAIVALVAAISPWGTFWGMGLSGMSAVSGWLAYRRRGDAGWARLAGAGAMALGITALVIATGRFALTYWAVGEVAKALG